MATFQVEVIETLSRIIEVEADTIEDAVSSVHTQYAEEEIVLDHADFTGYDINEYKD